MTTPSVESATIVERLREHVTIGFHSDGYAMIGRDKDGLTASESRSPTPMTRLANRDGPEAADTITALLEALESELRRVRMSYEETPTAQKFFRRNHAASLAAIAKARGQ